MKLKTRRVRPGIWVCDVIDPRWDRVVWTSGECASAAQAEAEAAAWAAECD